MFICRWGSSANKYQKYPRIGKTKLSTCPANFTPVFRRAGGGSEADSGGEPSQSASSNRPTLPPKKISLIDELPSPCVYSSFSIRKFSGKM